jgi:hypothetical protein
MEKTEKLKVVPFIHYCYGLRVVNMDRKPIPLL